MTMFLRSAFLLSVLTATASCWEFGLTNPAVDGGFTCSIEGASGKEACDASKDDDGSQCVFCELQSFGFCVSEEQAEAMKQAIPGLECDDDDNNDDDATPADDDVTPDDDDSTPDDYWRCLKGHSDQDSCIDDGCEWCTSKGGYGLCLSKEAAEKFDGYDFFDCAKETELFLHVDWVNDPYDPTCLQASLEGDKSICDSTTDEDGNPCEWCDVASANLCLSNEQAEIAEQFGGDCSTDRIDDPYDTSCLTASLSGDEASCEATVDADGNGCEWCTINTANLCLNTEQAEIAEQMGGQCSHADVDDQDPYDSSCLQASMEGDEATCEATSDEDGNPCEWCTVSGANLCLTSDQAQAAELIGGQCSSEDAADPYDSSCLQASLQGDESSCEAAIDEDGSPCEWCTVAGANLCLTSEQAEAAAVLGGECNSVDENFF